MDILVLCAGYGSRLAPLTDRIPKPLVPVGDKLSLEHQLDKLSPLEANATYINAHHLSDQLVSFTEEDSRIDHCFVEEEILGTGGPLRRAFLEKDCDELLVVNGDVFHHLDLEDFVKQSRASGAEFAMLMMDNPAVNSVGVKSQRMVSVKNVYGEEQKCDDFVTFTGISWFSKVALSKINEHHFSIVKYWKEQAESNNFPFAQIQSATWIDIGTPEGLWEASKVRWQELGVWPIYNWVSLETRSPIPTDLGPGLYGRDFKWPMPMPDDLEN